MRSAAALALTCPIMKWRMCAWGGCFCCLCQGKSYAGVWRRVSKGRGGVASKGLLAFSGVLRIGSQVERIAKLRGHFLSFIDFKAPLEHIRRPESSRRSGGQPPWDTIIIAEKGGAPHVQNRSQAQSPNLCFRFKAPPLRLENSLSTRKGQQHKDGEASAVQEVN